MHIPNYSKFENTVFSVITCLLFVACKFIKLRLPQFNDVEQFRDIFGCGAFSPTWTYVCCATLDKLEEEGWRPTPDLWFLPSHDGSPPAKDVDASAPFPVILPWPGFEDAESSPEIKDSGESNKVLSSFHANLA